MFLRPDQIPPILSSLNILVDLITVTNVAGISLGFTHLWWLLLKELFLPFCS